jgi:hypothetical protein
MLETDFSTLRNTVKARAPGETRTERSRRRKRPTAVFTTPRAAAPRARSPRRLSHRPFAKDSVSTGHGRMGQSLVSVVSFCIRCC